MVPTSQDISTPHCDGIVGSLHAEQIVSNNVRARLTLGGSEQIALDGQLITIGKIPVRPKACMGAVPPVERRAAAGSLGRAFFLEIAAEDTITAAAAGSSTVLNQALGTIFGARARCDQSALSIFGTFRYDIDHAVHGVSPPNCPAGPADDLDAFDVFERDILLVPVDSRELGGVHSPSIDEH